MARLPALGTCIVVVLVMSSGVAWHAPSIPLRDVAEVEDVAYAAWRVQGPPGALVGAEVEGRHYGNKMMFGLWLVALKDGSVVADFSGYTSGDLVEAQVQAQVAGIHRVGTGLDTCALGPALGATCGGFGAMTAALPEAGEYLVVAAGGSDGDWFGRLKLHAEESVTLGGRSVGRAFIGWAPDFPATVSVHGAALLGGATFIVNGEVPERADGAMFASFVGPAGAFLSYQDPAGQLHWNASAYQVALGEPGLYRFRVDGCVCPWVFGGPLRLVGADVRVP